MPTYQYACTACHHELEAVQSFTDDALTECPECGGKLRKLFGNVGVVFKGSGFYRNDARASGGSGSSDSSSSASSSTDGGGAKKSDGGTGSTSSDKSASSTSSTATSTATKSDS